MCLKIKNDKKHVQSRHIQPRAAKFRPQQAREHLYNHTKNQPKASTNKPTALTTTTYTLRKAPTPVKKKKKKAPCLKIKKPNKKHAQNTPRAAKFRPAQAREHLYNHTKNQPKAPKNKPEP
jgi:hypothetical protein